MKINLLLDELPQYVPNGLKIRTDFRESIKFELLMQDSNISKEEKIKCALFLYYYEPHKIKDVKTAIENIIWFYSGGKNDLEKEAKEEKNEKKQIYSYEFDDEYIYSAFLEQYKIDLNKIKYLHWWKFKAMMSCISENTQFSKIMGYRSIDLSSIKNQSSKNFYKRMKQIYAIPDQRTEAQKESDFADALW